MLWVELFGIDYGEEKLLNIGGGGGGGARYWRLVEAGVEYGETIKNPCVGRSLVGL